MTPPSHERMSAEFEKWHLGDGRALHHFTGPDRGGPHDHPMPMTITVLSGGYVERVFGAEGVRDLRVRSPGDTFTIQAEHIHEIVELPAGECWTLATYGPPERECRFWRFGDGPPQSRAWHEEW